MLSLKCPCCGCNVTPGENIPVNMNNKPKYIICANCDNELLIDKKSNYQRYVIGALGVIGIPLIATYFGFNKVTTFIGWGLIILLVIFAVVSHRRLKLVPVNQCK